MIPRLSYEAIVRDALTRSRVTAILGPRQCGKTTLARLICRDRPATFFDLESEADLARLQNAELSLSALGGLIVVDEIQRLPALFDTIRVVVDREERDPRFLILGSASPSLVRGASESLAGRVEFIELGGFHQDEVGTDATMKLWTRGGFPRSFLAESDEASSGWREGFVRTFLERDIPQLGITIPSTSMRRFWTMLAHYHGQSWNGSELGRSMGLTDKTVRNYLDILTGTYMVRQLQPWHENVAKRQVKSPKVYLRDTGLLHTLLSIQDHEALAANPRVGASWEGFVIEQVLQLLHLNEAYFWRTRQGAKIDLFFLHRGKRYGIEIEYSEAPRVTRSTHIAIEDLGLEHVWIIYPGRETYPVDERITMLPVAQLSHLPKALTDAA